MQYRLTIEGKMPSLNDYINACRRNMYAGAKMKKDVEENIIWQLKAKVRGIIINPPVKLIFNWFEENNKRDLDNIASAKKYILDSMVKSGILKNDNRNFVCGFEDLFPLPFVKKAKVEILIIEIPSDKQTFLNI